MIQRAATRVAFAAVCLLIPHMQADAAPFRLRGIESGGELPDVSGAGFTASSGEFYKDVANPAVFPTSAAFHGVPILNLEQDSSWTIDPFGPNVAPDSNHATRDFYGNYPEGTYQTTTTTTPFALSVTPGSAVSGERAFFAFKLLPPGGPFSGMAPNPSGGRSTLDGVFIGRATVEDGASVSGDALFDVEGANPAIVELDGAPVLIGDQMFALRSYLVIDDGPAGDTFDLWFQVIPAPGVLFAFLPLALMKRQSRSTVDSTD